MGPVSFGWTGDLHEEVRDRRGRGDSGDMAPYAIGRTAARVKTRIDSAVSDEAGFVHGTVIDVDGGRVGVAVIATP